MGAQGLHMDPNPKFDELPRKPNKEHILSANLAHSFFLFSLFKFFWARFLAIFDPPLCLYLRQRSPYGPQLRILSFELGISKKIKDLDY